MKCSEIMAKLEELSPLSFAESWDNVGPVSYTHLDVYKRQEDGCG